MLYDPKWEIKPLTFSPDGLIEWLEKQPAAEVYDYHDCDTCLAAQFNAACGLEYYPPNPLLFWKFWTDFRYKLEWLATDSPRTFGAALDRARKAFAK
jgi:hypothetical protein